MLYLSPLCVSLSLSQWLEKVNGWLSKVFLSQTQSLEGDATLKRWRCHMHSFFYLIYVSMRIEELFSIIRGEGCLQRHTPSFTLQCFIHRHVLLFPLQIFLIPNLLLRI